MQYGFFDENKKLSENEKKLTAELAELRSRKNRMQLDLEKEEERVKALKESRSFRLGLAVVYIPKKIRKWLKH